MCTLYALLAKRKKLKELSKIDLDHLEEEVERESIYPDQQAAVIRKQSGKRELLGMHWGFPPPPTARNPVVNVRNTRSPFWEPWLQSGFRCVVPFTSFCEWETRGTRKRQIWFRGSEEGSILFFAGIWRHWQGLRGGVEGNWLLYSILTTEPNSLVAGYYPKAMPVVLSSAQQVETWLDAPMEEALSLQQPAAEDLLVIAENTDPDEGPGEFLMPWG